MSLPNPCAERDTEKQMGETAAERRQQYREVYLRSEHWQQVRARALARAEHRCQLCNDEKHLDVHHRTYERLGQERDSDLTVLCRRCHDVFHGGNRQVQSGVKVGRKARRKKVSMAGSATVVPIKKKRRQKLLNQRIDAVLPVLRLGPATTAEVAQRSGLKLGQAGTTLAVLQARRVVTRKGKGSEVPWYLL